jgi:hypothetical protein
MLSIEFHHEEGMDGVFPNPVKSQKLMPKYFKDLDKKYDNKTSYGGKTVKKCIPFIDAMSAGYIIPLWSDVYITANNGSLKIDFPPNLKLNPSLERHTYEQMENHPKAEEPYGKYFMKFMNPWVIKTSPGVSCLFTSPLNHMEKRIKILDGVVDCDTYYNNINFPFIWIGGDGEFLIPKGTPLVQVIPFQRITMEMRVSCIDKDLHTKKNAILGTTFSDGYRNNFWHKRTDNDTVE